MWPGQRPPGTRGADTRHLVATQGEKSDLKLSGKNLITNCQVKI